MSVSRVVEELDVLSNRLMGRFPRWPGLPVDELRLQRAEEALQTGLRTADLEVRGYPKYGRQPCQTTCSLDLLAGRKLLSLPSSVWRIGAPVQQHVTARLKWGEITLVPDACLGGLSIVLIGVY